MKIFSNLIKPSTFIALLGIMVCFSCSKELPKNVSAPDKKVVLQSIKIVNAGAGGNTVVEGTVDENKKTVSFPRIDPKTDFSKIQFEAELSSGAALEEPTYNFDFKDGDSKKTIVVKVVNKERFREYLVTIRLDVPVYGADFGKPDVHDYTNNDLGNPIYPTFTSLLTRGTGFDGKHVLIVTRATGGSHLLKVSDLENDKIDPIYLNMNGVSGGTFSLNCGALSDGHIYAASLSGGQVSPLKIYHWDKPEDDPEVIADLNIATIPGAGNRHGDNMSVTIDESGNGYMYFGDNGVTEILRLKVSNFTTISDPQILPTKSGVTAYMSMTRVGTTDKYLFTGYEAPIMVTNESASVAFTLDANAVPLRGSDARVVYFNNERYLMMTTAARRGSDATVLYVYDITKGKDIVEALEFFENSDRKPLYQYALQGPTNAAPGTQTGWWVKKDDEGKDQSLLLYTATADAGFVLIEFPKKEKTD